jgi:hypothetical protein
VAQVLRALKEGVVLWVGNYSVLMKLKSPVCHCELIAMMCFVAEGTMRLQSAT